MGWKEGGGRKYVNDEEGNGGRAVLDEGEERVDEKRKQKVETV